MNTVNTLKTITENKVEINNLKELNTTLISEVLVSLNTKVKELRDEPKYKDTKKSTLCKIVKSELNSKEDVINVAFNIIELGLNIDNTLSLSKIKQTVSLINKGVLTKSFVNKADKEALETKLATINKANKLEQAKKLLAK